MYSKRYGGVSTPVNMPLCGNIQELFCFVLHSYTHVNSRLDLARISPMDCYLLYKNIRYREIHFFI